MFLSYIGQPLDTACAHMFNVGKTGGLSYGKWSIEILSVY